jgi:hypothetical protein
MLNSSSAVISMIWGISSCLALSYHDATSQSGIRSDGQGAGLPFSSHIFYVVGDTASASSL